MLVGGPMVLLHAVEHDSPLPRVSMDLDVIVNARVQASVCGFVTESEALWFVLDGMSPELLAHRYRRGAASIDVPAPPLVRRGHQRSVTVDLGSERIRRCWLR